MISRTLLGIAFLTLNSICVLGLQILKIEAENYWKNFIYRHSASQEKTVSMLENDILSLPFCLRRRTYVGVSNIIYTNDGKPNTVRMTLDSTPVGDWTSHNLSDSGHLWNTMFLTGNVGMPVELTSGPHRLFLHVLPSTTSNERDLYGLEIDAVYLAVDDNDISSNFFNCLNTMCSDQITYRDRHRDRDDVPSGKIVQMSRPSQCLEEDNIKVPIYHENVKQFRISALPPRYRTFWTYKEARFDGCPEYSNYHWQYAGVNCQNLTQNRFLRLSRLSYESGPDNTTCIAVIRFDLQGISYGKTDAHIGDILEVGMTTNASNVSIQPSFGVMKDNQMVYDNLSELIINSSVSMATWEFPDLTWSDLWYTKPRFQNEIRIEIPINETLKFVQLKRRLEQPVTITDIYFNQQLKIQKVEFDFWWRDAEIESGREPDMEIYLATVDGEIYKGTGHYIVFIERRIWAPDGDMDHTFVLYQDGSARILPIVPHGLETYVPFGNDIVIGQADPMHMRPHAPIKKLVIRPEKQMMDVYYKDGGFAVLHIDSGIVETNVTVMNVSFASDYRQKPFAIFRSTWVEDGMAKVDHVTVNGLQANHILLDGWTTKYGNNFVFFRKCISAYNSQSPDFSIEILSPSEIKDLLRETT